MSKKEILHIYIRCSQDKQIEKSVDRQKSKGIEFSKQLGMKPKFWIDGGKSRFGGLDKREQITDFLTEVELGVVITYGLRIGQESREMLKIYLK